MNREQKQQQIEELKEKISSSSFIYFTDASSMSVEQINNFRRKCFEKEVNYKVYKNTLIKKAMDELENDYSNVYELLHGTTSLMFSTVGNLPAKILKEFRGSDAAKPVLKGAYIDSDVFIGDNQLDTLSKLKSKEDLIGEVITLLQSPAKNVISALQSGGQTIAGVVKTLSERPE